MGRALGSLGGADVAPSAGGRTPRVATSQSSSLSTARYSATRSEESPFGTDSEGVLVGVSRCVGEVSRDTSGSTSDRNLAGLVARRGSVVVIRPGADSAPARQGPGASPVGSARNYRGGPGISTLSRS